MKVPENYTELVGMTVEVDHDSYYGQHVIRETVVGRVERVTPTVLSLTLDEGEWVGWAGGWAGIVRVTIIDA